MLVRLYVVFDKVSGLCSGVGDAVNDGVALRNFNVAMKDNPAKEDCQLLYVGELNQEQCVIYPQVPPKMVSIMEPVETKMEDK